MPEGERRNRVMNFRVRKDEEDRLRAAAEEEKMPLANWLRVVALRAAAKRMDR